MHEDCFAYQNMNGKARCAALTSMNCVGCAFYKTVEQKKIDQEKADERLRLIINGKMLLERYGEKVGTDNQD